jgi:hypothetical protein
MQKTILTGLLLLAGFCVHAQDTKILKLRKEAVDFSPRSFYIAAVKDDRADTTNIGMVKIGVFNKLMYAQLEGGAAVAISKFMAEEVQQDTSATPITLHITRLKVGEKNVNLHEEADLDMAVSFYYGNVKAIEYRGSASHQTNIDATHYTEEMVRQNLVSCIKQFDDWWPQNKAVYMAVADRESGKKTEATDEPVTVEVQMDTLTDDTDHILYRRQRPLSYADFKAKPDDLNLGAAATYSVINMGYRSENYNGKWKIIVSISVYMDKSQSWTRTKTKAVLEHEQLHFDISAVKGCELANAIKADNYTYHTFESKLKALHKKYSAENIQMQNDYDRETKHSILIVQQANWKAKINTAVESATCY